MGREAAKRSACSHVQRDPELGQLLDTVAGTYFGVRRAAAGSGGMGSMMGGLLQMLGGGGGGDQMQVAG
jgi:hypothetical protein